jgi:uncharacterized damage-inducible protein DinB
MQECKMKEIFLTFAQYNREANKTVVALLKELTLDEREKDRGSFYKSLSGLLVHILGGSKFLLGLFKSAVPHNAAAIDALNPLDKIALPEGRLSEAQWKQLEADLALADDACVNFAATLTEADMKTPVNLNWYAGNPPSVPLSFMFQQFISHGTHHRGQISQILDELTVANDYSGINVAFVPK